MRQRPRVLAHSCTLRHAQARLGSLADLPDSGRMQTRSGPPRRVAGRSLTYQAVNVPQHARARPDVPGSRSARSLAGDWGEHPERRKRGSAGERSGASARVRAIPSLGGAGSADRRGLGVAATDSRAHSAKRQRVFDPIRAYMSFPSLGGFPSVGTVGMVGIGSVAGVARRRAAIAGLLRLRPPGGRGYTRNPDTQEPSISRYRVPRIQVISRFWMRGYEGVRALNFFRGGS